MTLVWAYKKLKVLNSEVGFVVCDPKTADKLLKKGDVQDPRVGSLALKPIDYTEPKQSRKRNNAKKD